MELATKNTGGNTGGKTNGYTINRLPVWRCIGILAQLILLAAPLPVAGHRSIELQVEILSKKIESEPGNTEYYLARSQRYREHKEMEAALADLETARKIDPSLSVIDFFVGRLLQEMGHSDKALVHLDRFLNEDPDNLIAKKVRARALVDDGQYSYAASEFSEIIGMAKSSGPDLYLERAHALQKAGPAYYPAAIEGLDEGMARLGNLAVLQIAAIEILSTSQQWQSALARVDRLLADANRKERWYALEGDIYSESGDRGNARESYLKALAAIDSLSESKRLTRAIQRLTNELEIKLEAL